MQNWMLPRISDYWDEQAQAIDRLSHVLDAVPPSQRDGQVGLIRAAIARHVEALSDVQLTRAAFTTADDLYKAADRLSHWDYPLELYLWATANCFFEAVRARGFLLSYVVDNSFEDLMRPVLFYPVWYKPTGLCYICPTALAYSLPICEKLPKDDWPKDDLQLRQPLDPARLNLIPSYIAEAREIACQAIRECYDRDRHFVLLTTDGQEDGFSAALDASGHRRVIRVFRNEAPIAGSRCTVSFPN
jgi:hypothetical protein